MNKVELETWLTAARASTIAELKFGSDWWPMTTGSEQAYASAWALAFFIHAAHDRCAGNELTAACSAGDKKEDNDKILKALWTNGSSRLHQPEQVLVDFSVHNWNASSPIQLTGESETYAAHGVGDSLTSKDGYSWDFYKLLIVPSATRLFFARVGGADGEDASTRCSKLAQTLMGLVDWYGPALLRPHDELGAVILPSAKKAHADTILLWLDRGRLRQERISKPLLLNAGEQDKEST
ncbi:hypothetical protein [Sorangium sp. So ce362]|uniref:hypothetical protein n=1 Tax=Sorangium sp. So ce362 TaxID=3133303 RepID=UPI003F618F56